VVDKPLVVVTGASSGIGEATARAFANAGYPLLLLARRVERMEGFGLPNAMCRNVDVRDREAIATAIAEAEAAYGPVDCLVNNAGVASLGDIARLDPAQGDLTIDVNAKGVMNGVHGVMHGMMERRRGTIVNMSSIGGRKIYPHHTIYCGTKYFVHAVTESLRAYLAPHNVRVMVIAPGFVDTEILEHVTDEEVLAGYDAAREAIGGPLAAEHVADAILYAYKLPQDVLIQEICITPTRQEY
jgi:NADP-dependent 3-hydroxy acid dehydrogenase YdfG